MTILRTTLQKLFLHAGILLLICSLLYSAKSQRAKAEFWFNLHSYFPEGTVEEHWCFSKAIKADPSFAKAWLERSVSLNRSGMYANGFQFLNKAVALEPAKYLGYRAYVKLYMLHDYEGAIDDLETLEELTPGVEIAPWNESIYHMLGMAYKQEGYNKTAINYFNKAIKTVAEQQGLDALSEKTFFYRGIAKLDMRRPKSAVKDFNRALRLAENFMEAYYYRGLALARMYKRGSACRSLRMSLELHEEGYVQAESNYEIPDQVYLSDIEEALQRYCKSL